MLQEVAFQNLSLFAQQFWKTVGNAKVFAFHGPMGAGKTTVITALCQYKGVPERISSPTFSIINQYTYTEDGEEKMIYHIDLYRLKNLDEIMQAGVEDCIYNGSMCMIEWPEKAPELFDEHTIHVYIEPKTATSRIVKTEKRLPKAIVS